MELRFLVNILLFIFITINLSACYGKADNSDEDTETETDSVVINDSDSKDDTNTDGNTDSDTGIESDSDLVEIICDGETYEQQGNEVLDILKEEAPCFSGYVHFDENGVFKNTSFWGTGDIIDGPIFRVALDWKEVLQDEANLALDAKVYKCLDPHFAVFNGMAADLVKMMEDADKVCPPDWEYEPNYDFEITMNSDGEVESVLKTLNTVSSGTLANIECIKTATENKQYDCLYNVKVDLHNLIYSK